ncbi:HNH endonuclease [Okeania sp. KiyG1]
MEIDHIILQYLGGKNNMANKKFLHNYCHHQKIFQDGSRDRKSN